MQRRKTTIGRGPFGRTISTDKHADEVLRRIRSKSLPLSEDAVFLCMYHILRRNNASRIFQKVRESKNVGGYRYFSFSPDIDLLEVRNDETVVGYELKGYRRSKREMKPPSPYEGIDQALAILKNPIRSPLSKAFAGSIFDYSYLVHPEGSMVDTLADLLSLCTPIGLIVVSHRGTKELVKPKRNPFLDDGMQSFFVSRLDTFSTYEKFIVNPIQ